MSLLGRVAVAFFLLGVLCGCPGKEERDREYVVGPDLIAKRDLAGLWVYRVGGLEGFSEGPGPCPSDRPALIRWDIQDGILYARLVDETHCWNWNYRECPLVGAWPVENLDVPPMTLGEWCDRDWLECCRAICCECNYIKDWDGLRRWYMREYIRVDWRQNLVIGMEVKRLTLERATADPTYPDVEPDDADTPRVVRNASGAVHEISVATRASARGLDCDGPKSRQGNRTRATKRSSTAACLFPELSSCMPVEFALRQQFLKWSMPVDRWP